MQAIGFHANRYRLGMASSSLAPSVASPARLLAQQ